MVPLAIFPDSPPLVEGKILYKPCDFIDLFFFAHVLVEVQFLGYKFSLKGSTYTRENTVAFVRADCSAEGLTLVMSAIHQTLQAKQLHVPYQAEPLLINPIPVFYLLNNVSKTFIFKTSLPELADNFTEGLKYLVYLLLAILVGLVEKRLHRKGA